MDGDKLTTVAFIYSIRYGIEHCFLLQIFSLFN